MPPMSRRSFVTGFGALTAASLMSSSSRGRSNTAPAPSFNLSVIADEISQDFGHALEVASKEFGLSYVELRELWGKNLMKLDEKEIEEAKALLRRFGLGVSSIASPVFKVDWPGAPAPTGEAARDTFGGDFVF